MRDGAPRDAVRAATAILDRAVGRPVLPVAGVPGSPLQVEAMSVEEKRARLKDLVASATARIAAEVGENGQ
jgi:hypothetical protein